MWIFNALDHSVIYKELEGNDFHITFTNKYHNNGVNA